MSLTVAAGIAIASAVSGAISSSKAKKEAKEISRANLRLHETTTTQNLEQMQKQADQVMGLGRAQVFAGGLQMTGSSKSYLDALEGEMVSEMDWYRQRASQEAAIIKKGGQVVAREATTMGFQSLLGGLSQAAWQMEK